MSHALSNFTQYILSSAVNKSISCIPQIYGSYTHVHNPINYLTSCNVNNVSHIQDNFLENYIVFIGITYLVILMVL